MSLELGMAVPGPSIPAQFQQGISAPKPGKIRTVQERGIWDPPTKFNITGCAQFVFSSIGNLWKIPPWTHGKCSLGKAELRGGD